MSHWRIFIHSRTIVNKSFSTIVHPQVTFASSLAQHPVRLWLAVGEPGPHFLTISCSFPNVQSVLESGSPWPALLLQTFLLYILFCVSPPPTSTALGNHRHGCQISSSTYLLFIVFSVLGIHRGSSKLTAFCGLLKGSRRFQPEGMAQHSQGFKLPLLGHCITSWCKNSLSFGHHGILLSVQLSHLLSLLTPLPHTAGRCSF